MKIWELKETPEPFELETETRMSVTHLAVVQDEETGIVSRMPLGPYKALDIRFNLGLGGAFRPDLHLGAVGGE